MRVKPCGRDALQSQFIALLLIVLLIVGCSVALSSAHAAGGLFALHYPLRTADPTAVRVKAHNSSGISKAVAATFYNLSMKQACAFEDKTGFQPTPDTTRWAPELPRTSLAYRHNETGRKRAR
jgi:hypothetical protein